MWLLSWLPDQGTPLHDHGTSAGAFAVVDGTLTERIVAAGRDGVARDADDLLRPAGSGPSARTTSTR